MIMGHNIEPDPLATVNGSMINKTDESVANATSQNLLSERD